MSFATVAIEQLRSRISVAISATEIRFDLFRNTDAAYTSVDFSAHPVYARGRVVSIEHEASVLLPFYAGISLYLGITMESRPSFSTIGIVLDVNGGFQSSFIGARWNARRRSALTDCRN